MADDNPIVGRQIELKALEDALADPRSRLILLVGGPGTGKGRILRELRMRAAQYPCLVVPNDPVSDRAPPGLVIDKHYTIDDFRAAVEDEVRADVWNPGEFDLMFDLVLVYGYRPEEEFHGWFVDEFLREPTRTELRVVAERTPHVTGEPGRISRRPRVVVVAGSAADLARLAPLADLQVALGPLPRHAVMDELRAIDATIAVPLEKRELNVYADAIVANPSVITALRRVLPLLTGTQTALNTKGER